MLNFFRFILSLIFILCQLEASCADIDELYNQYSSRDHIALKRREKLEKDAHQRVKAILKHLAAAQRASLKHDFSPELKKSRMKRSQSKSLKKLLEKVSPLKKEEP